MMSFKNSHTHFAKAVNQGDNVAIFQCEKHFEDVFVHVHFADSFTRKEVENPDSFVTATGNYVTGIA